MGSNLESRLFEGLEDLFKEGLVSDALIAQSEKQAKEFWDLRENIPEANRRIGSISNHDISLPISLIPKFIQEMPTYMAHLADLRINCFGHLGDGNLHYNVFPPLGKNKNDASLDIENLGLKVVIKGAGKVNNISPAIGTKVKQGAVITLTLR